MTHEDWVRYTDQLENSLARAEAAQKDKDIIVLLRMAYQICKERMIETDERRTYFSPGTDKR